MFKAKAAMAAHFGQNENPAALEDIEWPSEQWWLHSEGGFPSQPCYLLHFCCFCRVTALALGLLKHQVLKGTNLGLGMHGPPLGGLLRLTTLTPSTNPEHTASDTLQPCNDPHA